MHIRWWWLSFVVLLALLSADILSSIDNLPAIVANHFNASGVADGTTSRTTHVALMLFTVNFVALITAGSTALVSKLPPDLINLPNKDRWLSVDQRDLTFAFMQKWGILMGAATAAFMWHLHQKLVAANQLQPPVLENFWMSLGVFLAFTVVMIAVLMMRFRVPRKPISGS
jgi:hypothetical protein